VALGSLNGIRVLIGLVGIGACFAAASYAAGRHQQPPSAGAGGKGRPALLPKPAIGDRPDARSPSTRARFGFSAKAPALRFECRLDDARWAACRTPVLVTGLAVGRHRFAVRAVDSRHRHGAAARFRWTVLEAKDFAIVPDLSRLRSLYPGAPPVALPLTVRNPNPAPILVTALRVAVAADPPGCPSAGNLALVQSNASRSTPLEVAAGRTVGLPAQGILAPTIQLRDLPVNQDACQNIRFPLEFTGSARG
jgi:hypothetical protein